MNRTISAIVVVFILATGASPGGAQPSAPAASSLPALAEANRLNDAALKLEEAGKYQEAIPLAQRALALFEKALSPTDSNVAAGLNNLAKLYQDQGAYTQAEPMFVRALDIFEKSQGPTSESVATSLNNLAVLYHLQGAYAKAEPLLVRALGIREKLLGPMHPDVATTLINLAGLYQMQGNYPKAEPCYTRALSIFEKSLGPTHPYVALTLNNTAELYRAQGAYAKAEPLYKRAAELYEKALGPMHPNVALSLNNLANIYLAQSEYAKAEPLYLRAFDIFTKVLGPLHPYVATNVANLAAFYKEQGKYLEAEMLLARVLDMYEKTLGPAHPNVAEGARSLAEVYLSQGEYAKAEPLYMRSLHILESALGPLHPGLAASLNGLALLHRGRGDNAKAEAFAARAVEIDDNQLRLEIATLPEARKRSRMALVQGETDSVVSLQADMPQSTPALELALTTVLRRKGLILDSLVERQSALRAHLTPRLRDQIDQLNAARSELVSQIYSQTPGDRATIDKARARMDALESALSAASADYRATSELVKVTTIQALLPRDAALVEFARYHRFDAKNTLNAWQEEHYVAYLVTPHGPLQAIALGEAAPIDAAIDSVLAATNGAQAADSAQPALQHLDGLLLAPIRAHLEGVVQLILAPEGKLNQVPFDALIDSEGHYALDRYLISYVTSGRDLLRMAISQQPRSPSVIVAGPDYGPLPPSGAPRFTQLDGALAEAADLRRYFVGPPVTAGRATKALLAALAGPAMLHVATHGFYARDASASAVPAPTQPASEPARQSQPTGTARDQVVESGASLLPQRPDDLADSLDRAGLAMAGANQGPGGIVTAREISGFDWRGTQLVVLSACETGVGAVASGDGVYGLRRALVLAGTASQVVSLWSVNDAVTRELMKVFYGELALGTGRAESLRRAKRALINQVQFAHPYYWAAFIPAGDWAPLARDVIPRQGKPR